jgi:hypothetical protein
LNPNGVGADPGSNVPNSTLSVSGSTVAIPGIAHTPGQLGTPVITNGYPQSATLAADLSKSLIIDARGDMLELELKIIGDPHFIKQDDVFYSRPTTGQNAALTPNKSLYMDIGELYVFVNFLSPVDYNEEKGLAEVRANDTLGRESDIAAKNIGYSNFSGVYKIISVDSIFSRGKFEQILRMAKVLYDQLGAETNQSNAETARLNRAGNKPNTPSTDNPSLAEYTALTDSSLLYSETSNNDTNIVNQQASLPLVNEISIITNADWKVGVEALG